MMACLTMEVRLKAATDFYKTRKRHFILSLVWVCIYSFVWNAYVWAYGYFEIIVFIYSMAVFSTHLMPSSGNDMHFVVWFQLNCIFFALFLAEYIHHFAIIFMMVGKENKYNIWQNNNLINTRDFYAIIYILHARTHVLTHSHINRCHHSNCTTIFSNFTF